MDTFEIDRINRFVEGSKWAFHPEQDPPVYTLKNPFGDINIEIKHDDLETSFADILQFRKGYDYRIESWSSAEKREDGRLRINNKQKQRLDAKLDAFYDIVGFEQKLLRYIWSGIYPEEQFDLSPEDINNLIKIGKERNLEFTSVLRKDEIIHFYISDCYPDVTYRLPLVAANISLCASQVNDAYKEFDIERELIGCLIEKYGHTDISRPEAKEIRSQLEEVRNDLHRFRYSMDMYWYSRLD